jgi:hypothetical protein
VCQILVIQLCIVYSQEFRFRFRFKFSCGMGSLELPSALADSICLARPSCFLGCHLHFGSWQRFLLEQSMLSGVWRGLTALCHSPPSYMNERNALFVMLHCLQLSWSTRSVQSLTAAVCYAGQSTRSLTGPPRRPYYRMSTVLRSARRSLWG